MRVHEMKLAFFKQKCGDQRNTVQYVNDGTPNQSTHYKDTDYLVSV